MFNVASEIAESGSGFRGNALLYTLNKKVRVNLMR